MEKYRFISLCHVFRWKDWLTDGKHLNVEEKMFVFNNYSQNLKKQLTKNNFNTQVR